MKILLLSHYFHPSIGGIELISNILAEALTDSGHEVRVMTWSLDPEKTKFRFEVVRNPSFLTLIKEHVWADMVFENNICIRLGWPRLLFRKPVVIGLQTWLGSQTNEANYQWKIKRKWLGSARKVVACSKMIKDDCWPDAQIIRNPYQEDVFKIMPQIDKNLDFVFLGRLVSDKGADLAIQAFKKVAYDFKERDIFLTIVGDGLEMNNLKKMVTDYDLNHLVTFKGSLQGSELAECLNQHKSLLVPSRWKEPFGIVALEGMACGCIPIVSDGGGLPFAIGNGGLTFSRNNVDDLANKMSMLLTNIPLTAKLKQEMPAQIKIHSSKEISAQYISLFEAVMKAH
ncbi:glycosyltransferase family 4 protein [Aurantibacter sp.]|uniref:glycosyltransferase family 4 protein n=1 Tax=Aurantibacter sp. TaxID=2807103 RepID=UPI003265FC86